MPHTIENIAFDWQYFKGMSCMCIQHWVLVSFIEAGTKYLVQEKTRRIPRDKLQILTTKILCQEELFSIDLNVFRPHQASLKNLNALDVYPLLLTKYVHANDFCTPPNQLNKLSQQFALRLYLPWCKVVIVVKKYQTHY